MVDIHVYHIEVQDRVEEETVIAGSPITVQVLRAGSETSLLEVLCDQAGLVGLIRHLHQQRFVLLSLHRLAK